MMNMQAIQNIDNSTPITFEEGYEITRFYVNYFWMTNKYYSLKDEYEEDDVVHILMMKFMKHNHFEKYDSRITSKKYHIMNAVRTSMIDLLRKHREVVSIDAENEEGFSIVEAIPSEEPELLDMTYGKEKRDAIIEQLPAESKSAVKGFSPLFQREVNLSYRMLALHLEAGFRVKDMAKFYRNPATNEPISEGTISSYIRNMREYVLDNIVIA